MQAINRPARRSGPTNTEHRWDYEQCCNVALRHSVISPKIPGKIRLTVRYFKKIDKRAGFLGCFATGKRLIKESIEFGINRLERAV